MVEITRKSWQKFIARHQNRSVHKLALLCEIVFLSRFTRDELNYQLLEDSKAEKRRKAEEKRSFYASEDVEEEEEKEEER